MASITVTETPDLVAAVRRAAPGDIILLSGTFAPFELGGIRPERPITLSAAAPGAARIEKVVLNDCANLTFSHISFWPSGPLPQARAKQYGVTAYPNCARIEVSNCLFRGRADSDNHARWTLDDWNAAKFGGALLRGPNSVVRNCAAIGVQMGFGVSGANSELFRNSVFGFSGDGLRITNDNCVAIGNRITDAMQIDGNHSDGFQAFKIKELLNGVVVKDNVLVEWTVRPDNPLRAKMQGISFHGGPYANIVIRDNAVATSAWNGININSATNVTVVGNRIRHADGPTASAPWIRIQNSSGEIIVENNEAELFKLQKGVVSRGNRKPDYRARF